MFIYTPYAYRIGWSNLGKNYYGVQYGKDCSPENLWKTYFTSSNYVKRFRELHGEPDIIQVRKTFSNKKDAIIWEQKVLQKLGVPKNDTWLNKNVAGAFDLDEEILKLRGEKISRSLKGKVPWNRGKKTGPNGLKGVLKSEETKSKMRKPKSDASKMGIYERSETTIQKLREANIGCVWWTNGIETKKVKVSPGDGWYRKPRKKYEKKGRNDNSSLKGYRWWNDNNINKRAKTSPGAEWEVGYLNPRWIKS